MFGSGSVHWADQSVRLGQQGQIHPGDKVAQFRQLAQGGVRADHPLVGFAEMGIPLFPII